MSAQQPSLFELTHTGHFRAAKAAASLPPHQRSSQTSRAGARCAAPRHGTQLAEYLAALHAAGPVSVDGLSGGLTDREAANLLGWEINIVNARRGSLEGRRYAVDSGKRRDGGKGVDVTVWVHTQHTGAKR